MEWHVRLVRTIMAFFTENETTPTEVSKIFPNEINFIITEIPIMIKIQE